MSEKVWIRDYAEKVGAEVEWDAERGWVKIDGEYNLIPDEVRDGKSYIDKKVIDAALHYLGYDTPDETPSTSKPTREMEEEEKRNKYYESLTSRAIPGWSEIRDYIYQHAYKPIRDWVIEHFWQPILDWVKPFVESIRQLLFSVRDIWASLWEFLEKLKYSIRGYANTVKQTVVEWASPVINWFSEKWGYLEWLVHHEVLESINYLVNQKNKFIYVFTVAFNRLFAILEAPVHFISDAVVSGFEFWSEKIFSLIEDYVVMHWEDTR